MKIVVTTPTGHVGSRVTQLLVQAGVRPTLLLRSASRLDAELRDFADLVEGDQGDADYVVAATQAADALYWVSPPPEEDDPLAAYARFRDGRGQGCHRESHPANRRAEQHRRREAAWRR